MNTLLDAQLRRILDAPLTQAARWADVRWITPDRVTLAGLGFGLLSAAAAALQLWPLALALWVFSRLLDGVDGALARLRNSRSTPSRTAHPVNGAGGFLDIVADFTCYGSAVVGVAIGATTGFDAPWWPFLVVLFAYYVNGTAFLAFSSIAERTGRQRDDGRSLSFIGRIAEGGETILVHSLWLILPQWSWQIAVVWAVVVLLSAGQRVVSGYRALR